MDGDVLVIVSMPDAYTSVCVESNDFKRDISWVKIVLFSSIVCNLIVDEYNVANFVLMFLAVFVLFSIDYNSLGSCQSTLIF